MSLADFFLAAASAANFYSALAVFMAPGWLAARALHGRSSGGFFLAAAGFVYSLAVFAALAWPCLWLRAMSETFWYLLVPWWGTFLIVAFVAGCRQSQPFGAPAAPYHALETSSPDADLLSSTSKTSGRHGFVERLEPYVPIAWGAWTAFLAGNLAGKLSPWNTVPTADIAMLAIWSLAGLPMIRVFRGLAAADPSAPRGETPHRLWTTAAVATILVLMLGAAWSGRPDWDDAWYLAAVESYVAGGAMNAACPALPDEPVVPPYVRLLAWELWGATLCRASGVHPMVSHHTLLPPLLVMLTFTVRWRLIASRLLPPRLAPLAIVALAGYWSFWVSAYDSPGSYLLTRAWQGKTMLWTLAIPLQSLTLWSFLQSPSFKTWIACLLTSLGGLAMSSSSVYLTVVLVPVFCAAQWLAAGIVRKWRTYAVAMFVVVPQVLYGLMVRSGFGASPLVTERPVGSSWRQSVWTCIDYGSAELAWIALLPLLWAMVRVRQARAYLVGVPCLLLATVLNPLAYEMLAPRLTSYHTYYRLWWVAPIGDGLAVLAALLAAAACRRSRRGVPELAIVLGLVAGMAALPGRFVWSHDNEGPFRGLCAVWGENAYKIPADLFPIVDLVAREPQLRGGRLLLPEHLSQFFLPYASQVRYVSSRPTYTVDVLAALGRREEGEERVMLTTWLLGTKGTEFLALPTGIRTRFDFETAERLVDKYEVAAVVSDRAGVNVESRLERLGFTIDVQYGPFALWRRLATGAAPPTRQRGNEP